MKTFNITLISLLLLAVTTQAQTDNETKEVSTSVYLSYGQHFPGLSEVNAILKANDYAALTSNQHTYGLGLLRAKNRWIGQLDFYLYYQCIENAQDFCSDISANGLGLNAGYNLLSHKNWTAYPLAGLYFDRAVLKTSDNNTTQTGFSNYMGTARNQNQVYSVNLSTHIGFQADFKPLINERRPLSFGLRTGFFIPVLKTTWYKHDEEKPLEEGPSFNTGGGYVKVIIGFSI